ncbi:MAG: YecA family protein [Trueperaceae bacterium]
MTTPGRNDPCPCGSGKKYKHCCLRRPGGVPRVLDDVPPPGALQAAWDDAGEAGEAAAFSALLRDAVKDRDFTSLAEAQDFVESFTLRYNHEPVPGFDGLNPEQMQALLYAPTDSPEVLRIAESLSTPPSAPLLAWFHLIAAALGQDGVPATPKGNLPRGLCRDVLRTAQRDPVTYGPFRFDQDPDTLRGEEDAFELHDARVIAREAGLLRLHRRRWTLTKRARTALAADDDAAIYLRLFDALAHRIDWRYTTRYEDLDTLQPTWPFLIRLLQRYGDRPRSADFYVGALLEAFPVFEHEAIDRMEPWILDFDDPIEATLRMLRHRIEFLTMERFARPLGLVTLDLDVPDPDRPWDRGWIVQATPLACEVVRFEV